MQFTQRQRMFDVFIINSGDDDGPWSSKISFNLQLFGRTSTQTSDFGRREYNSARLRMEHVL